MELKSGHQLSRASGWFWFARRDEDGVVWQFEALFSALPPGWHEKYDAALPPPTPPRSGQIKEPTTGLMIDKFNEEDPAYKLELMRWECRKMAVAIYEACPGRIKVKRGREDWAEDEIVWRNTPDHPDKLWEEVAGWVGDGEVKSWYAMILNQGQLGIGDIIAQESGMFRYREVLRVLQNEAGDGIGSRDDLFSGLLGGDDLQRDGLDPQDLANDAEAG